MTLKQREQLDNFKSVLSMMYDTVSIDELVPSKSKKALIRVQYRNTGDSKILSAFFFYDLTTGDNKEVFIKDMEILPLSNNYVTVEESDNAETCFIKVLDRDTLEVIEETAMGISDKYKKLKNTMHRINYSYGYNLSKEGGYITVTVPVDDSGNKNIHGKPINLDYSFTRLKDGIFISNLNSVIRYYDNVEDMNLLSENELNTFNNRVKYYPIFNSKNLKEHLPQVMFIYFKDSDRIYAYNFETKQIHVVRDTRYKVTIPEFIERLSRCLDTTDKDRKEIYTREYDKFKGDLDKQREYERVQFELDCNSLINLNENKFDFNRVTYNGGEYLTLRTVLQCVKEYQRDYNGEVNIRHRFENILNYPMDDKDYLRDVDKEVMMSLTPYKIQSMYLIDEIRELQDSKQLGKFIITDEIITSDELIRREGLY